MIRLLPKSTHPDLLVGFETSDDAGVFRLSEHEALVQTIDFFTPVVDDPYSYGAIAAANSLSDIYAMGGRPITAMNVCCFDPTAAPPEVWAEILRGAYDKTAESGAVLVGGHSVEDKEPKFGLSVTGIVDPARMFANTHAQPGDYICLTKPLGTGIITTAHKFNQCDPEELDAATATMSALNWEACEKGLAAGVRCATDITGFSLVGHLFNIAKASGVQIDIQAKALPLLPGIERLTESGNITAGSRRNRMHLGEALQLDTGLSKMQIEVVLDPQTSGGLALFASQPIEGYPVIGQVVERGEARIRVQS